MTVVAEDKQGLYVIVGERVGRPNVRESQGQGLRKGAHVRAALVEGAVRVRYGGQEQHWPAYVSRRTVAAQPGYNADGTLDFRKGQIWKTPYGDTVIERLYNPGSSQYERGMRARATNGADYPPDGRYNQSAHSGRYDLVALVQDAP